MMRSLLFPIAFAAGLCGASAGAQDYVARGLAAKALANSSFANPQLWTAVGTKDAGISDTQALFETYDQSRLWDVLTTRGPISKIKLRYDNWQGGYNLGEVASTCGFTISAAIEVEPTQAAGAAWQMSDANLFYIPVTFGGSKTVTIPPNGHADSDPVNYPFFPGQSVYYRTWRMSQCGNIQMGANHYVDGSHFESTFDGFFQGVALGASSTPTTSPAGTLSAAYVNLPLKPGSVVLYGAGLTGSITDNGSGIFPTGNGLCTGTASTVNYTTGAISLCETTAVNPALVYVNGQGAYNVVIPDDTVVYNPAGFASWQTHTAYGPSAVVGVMSPQATKTPRTYLIAGDSIFYGWGNTISYNQSWVDILLSGSIGTIKIAAPGEITGNCSTAKTFWRRLGNVDPIADIGIFNYGTNDFGVSETLSVMETNWQACATKLATLIRGGSSNLYASTLLPRVASTTSNVPYDTAHYGAGSVASGSPSMRNAFNAFLYTQIGTYIAGVVDAASCVEAGAASQAGAGSGTLLNLNLTYDDLHPSLLGHQTIAACMASNPAFALPQ